RSCARSPSQSMRGEPTPSGKSPSPAPASGDAGDATLLQAASPASPTKGSGAGTDAAQGTRRTTARAAGARTGTRRAPAARPACRARQDGADKEAAAMMDAIQKAAKALAQLSDAEWMQLTHVVYPLRVNRAEMPMK